MVKPTPMTLARTAQMTVLMGCLPLSIAMHLGMAARHPLPLPGRTAAAASTPLLRTASPSMGLSLPGFGGRKGNAEPTEEMQARYRLLGVSPDATYDEITAAFNELKSKYAGEVKRIIKLEVAKDKILEERLRQRMSGALRSTVKESPFEINKKEPLIKLPPWLESVAELPTRDYLLRNIAIFAVIGLLPGLGAEMASSSITMGMAFCFFLLYNRGAPNTSNSDMDASMRPARPRPLLLTVGFTLLSAMIGGSFGVLVSSLVRFVNQQQLICVCANAALCLACSILKVHED